MKSSKLLINLCAIISILLGFITMWNMLSLNNNSFGIEFITYLMGGFAVCIGLLTLFRE
jgi:hypothetical protein